MLPRHSQRVKTTGFDRCDRPSLCLSHAQATLVSILPDPCRASEASCARTGDLPPPSLSLLGSVRLEIRGRSDATEAWAAARRATGSVVEGSRAPFLLLQVGNSWFLVISCGSFLLLEVRLMGNKIGRRRQVVDEKYTRPQGLYHHREIDEKKLRKLILESKLAPCYPGSEECALDLEECPICFLVRILPLLSLTFQS
ncbi:hypothetical protein GW17_00005140 [Ensete ventricosum]|nr:hypothetical protein GW17_00005140 [Ensete ventricosum]